MYGNVQCFTNKAVIAHVVICMPTNVDTFPVYLHKFNLYYLPGYDILASYIDECTKTCIILHARKELLITHNKYKIRVKCE